MTETIPLDTGQRFALDLIADRVEEGHPETILAGLAGTGKTYVAGQLPTVLGGDVAFCAYTGKAAKVLHRKLKGQETSTIHGLIYLPAEYHCAPCPETVWNRMSDEERAEFLSDNPDTDTEKGPPCHRVGVPHRDRCAECGIRFEKRDVLPPWVSAIVVDEASMVGESVYADLLSFQVPIVWVGDHGQLPPVKGGINIMGRRFDAELTTIHRQGEGSAVIDLAHAVRLSGRIPQGEVGDGVRKVTDNFWGYEVREFIDGVAWDAELMILCATNKTRVGMNILARRSRGFNPDEPQTGDRVICLKNNRGAGIVNGSTGTIREIGPARRKDGSVLHGARYYVAKIDLDGERTPYEGRIHRDQFNAERPLETRDGFDLFDYGYTMTVHKAQGSEAKKVVLLEEYIGFWPPETQKRWLYTAVTRSSKELLVVRRGR
jgi:exodeoxyribonuclease-5